MRPRRMYSNNEKRLTYEEYNAIMDQRELEEQEEKAEEEEMIQQQYRATNDQYRAIFDAVTNNDMFKSMVDKLNHKADPRKNAEITFAAAALQGMMHEVEPANMKQDEMLKRVQLAGDMARAMATNLGL